MKGKVSKLLGILLAISLCITGFEIPMRAKAAPAQPKRTVSLYGGEDEMSQYKYIHGYKLTENTFTAGKQSTVVVTFTNTCQKDEESIYAYDSYTFCVQKGKEVLSQKSITPMDLVTKVEIPTMFSEKGIYELAVYDGALRTFGFYVDEDAEESKLASLKITVKAATSSDGKEVTTGDSVSFSYKVYSKAQAGKLKINYTVSNADCEYHLFVRKGMYHESSYNPFDYEASKKRIVEGTDFYSELGELSTEVGKTHSVTLNAKFDKFDIYQVVLYNLTTKKKVADDYFYVTQSDYLIQRDVSNMKDNGVIPFNCNAKVSHFQLDKNSKISFKVEFPINYGKYLETFKWKYYYGNEDDDDYDDDDDDRRQIKSRKGSDVDDAFFTDNYKAIMTVKYTPAGSTTARKLFKKTIKGMYKAHSISFTTKELEEKILSTLRNDMTFAGIVTVEFSNEGGTSTDLFDFSDEDETIYNEAIMHFTESFKFSVSKPEKLTSAKVMDSSVERAYGEAASFKVSDTLGGKIYAKIYKGSNMIATINGTCRLDSTGTAAGTVYWNLKDESGNYVDAGDYSAKLYTINEYYVIDSDGKQSKKKVESDKKTVSFKVINPDRAFSLSTSISGISGDNYVYIENPVVGIGIEVNIGSRVTYKIKNASGSVIQSGSFEEGRGSYVYRANLGSSIKAGTYKAEVTGETLDGKSKTVTKSFTVRKLPKANIKGLSVSADSNTGVGSVSFKITQFGKVTVAIKSGSKTMQTVVSQTYSAGEVKATFGIGGYKPGTYSVSVSVKNSGGKSKSTKAFKVKKKPVIVKKPTVSALSIRMGTGKDGDTYTGTFHYTGKNAKIVIEIMYNDTEEIVRTFVAKSKYDEGTYTYTWDGFKSNGFRAWAGNYTMRVSLVNSAGSSGYLRQNFVIGVG